MARPPPPCILQPVRPPAECCECAHGGAAVAAVPTSAQLAEPPASACRARRESEGSAAPLVPAPAVPRPPHVPPRPAAPSATPWPYGPYGAVPRGDPTAKPTAGRRLPRVLPPRRVCVSVCSLSLLKTRSQRSPAPAAPQKYKIIPESSKRNTQKMHWASPHRTADDGWRCESKIRCGYLLPWRHKIGIPYRVAL